MHRRQTIDSTIRLTYRILTHRLPILLQQIQDKTSTVEQPTAKKSKRDWANVCTLATRKRSDTSKGVLNESYYPIGNLSLAEAKKSKSSDNATEAAAPITEKPKKTAVAQNVPDDKVSKAYAANLLETVGTGFLTECRRLTYTKLTFAADNTWHAEGVVAIMDEEMDCVETGTWIMDPAKSETATNMSWTVTSTDCPSRVAPIEMRLELILTGTAAGVNANFR